MSIQDAQTLDSIGVDAAKGEVVLTIEDGLDWDDGEAHILALQAKFNAYMDFIRSGGVAARMPQADGLRPHIAVYMAHEPPLRMREILESIGRFAREKNVGFSYGLKPA